MQIDIRLLPFYNEDFAHQFPRIAGLFRHISYYNALEQELSLYRLVDTLEGINRDPQVPTDIKQVIQPYAEKLVELKKTAREYLLARRLNQLDAALYRIEDQFGDLEENLKTRPY